MKTILNNTHAQAYYKKTLTICNRYNKASNISKKQVDNKVTSKNI